MKSLNLWKGKPCKKLSFGLIVSGGKNNQGRLTVYHRGGGHKRRYRNIDFKRNVYDVPGKVLRVEYDPNRTGRIALVCYSNGLVSYILAPQGLVEGDWVVSSLKNFLNSKYFVSGNAFLLKHLPTGSKVYNIEKFKGLGGIYARSAGTYGVIIKKKK